MLLNTKCDYIANVKKIKEAEGLVPTLRNTNLSHIDNGSFTEQFFKFI